MATMTARTVLTRLRILLPTTRDSLDGGGSGSLDPGFRVSTRHGDRDCVEARRGIIAILAGERERGEQRESERSADSYASADPSCSHAFLCFSLSLLSLTVCPPVVYVLLLLLPFLRQSHGRQSAPQPVLPLISRVPLSLSPSLLSSPCLVRL